MSTLLIALGAMIAYLIAYHTYGKWLSPNHLSVLIQSATTPSVSLFATTTILCPTDRSVLFGHHFTSIAGTGPIVGPAIAVMWGWLPALVWVLLGSVFVGAVHDFGASGRFDAKSRGNLLATSPDKCINRRVRLLVFAGACSWH